MNFDESVKYLYALGNEVLAMKLGLETTKKLLHALGNPERNFLKVQVAGTNGKGSTCAFLDAICRRANIKTGLFTSPHLISITERIKINGVEISEEKFAEHATKIREISEKLVAANELETVPTFFEQITAIGISAFAEAKIELAILETGLGGRFDSVTATRAEIVAITPIDFDHQQILGNTLAEIAAEKAAIIREDTLVIAAPRRKEVEKIIYGKCREVGVDLIEATGKVRLIEDLGGGLFYLNFSVGKNNYKVDFSMQGKHQWTNATTAIYIAENLNNYNFKISREAVEIGLKTAEHKGRLEFLRGANDVSFLLDGAHNVAGATALKNYLDEFIKQPITMIFGAMRDKDLSEISETLFPKADKLVFTKPDNERSMEAAELMKFLPKIFDKRKVFETESVAAALEIAEEISGAEHLICVTGSLYLVGEARNLLNNKQNKF